MAAGQLTPDSDAFTEAFQAIAPLHENQLCLLQAHYAAPDRTLTATQLAGQIGYANFNAVNLQYGLLAARVGKELGLPDANLSLLVSFTAPETGRNEHWELSMRSEVAAALEQLGWVTSDRFLSPEEVTRGQSLTEGSVFRMLVNAYERNPEARRRCIEHYGRACAACGMSFGAVYGPVAENFIHVHHLTPLSDIGEEYEVDPIADLRPVCPNCHAVLHLGERGHSIAEVRQLLERQRQV